MLVGTFAFANDSVELFCNTFDTKDLISITLESDDAGYCVITYEIYDVYGNVVGTFDIKWFSYTANSKADCLAEAVLQPTP